MKEDLENNFSFLLKNEKNVKSLKKKNPQMCACPNPVAHDNFKFCSHPHVENGYCNSCGEQVHVFQIDNENTTEKATLEDYKIIIESFKSLPQSIKDELIDYFSKENSLPSNIRSALGIIYQLSLTLANKKREEDKDDYGFVESNFNIEICKICKNKFGRKNINKISKELVTDGNTSCVIIDSPQKYVNPVCVKNQCENLISPLKNIFSLILKCDRDKSIFEINPENAVIAMISIFNDKYNYFNATLNILAKKNGLSAASLKNTKNSLYSIMNECNITLDMAF